MPKISTKQIIKKQQKQQEIPERKIRAGFIMNKSLGQHILKNPLVVNSIVEKVGVHFLPL